MIAELVLALGLVAVIEGLVLALAPKRLEDTLKALLNMSPEGRRNLGLVVVAIGVLVVWISRRFLN